METELQATQIFLSMDNIFMLEAKKTIEKIIWNIAALHKNIYQCFWHRVMIISDYRCGLAGEQVVFLFVLWQRVNATLKISVVY